MPEEPVLCYVEGCWAFFTTQPLDKQWGDDWNDAPYEHNAGWPYICREGAPDPPWEILQVAFTGPFDRPCEGHTTSPFSVEQINAGAIAWLRAARHTNRGQGTVIGAGTPLSQFIALVERAGGTVYLPHAQEAVSR